LCQLTCGARKFALNYGSRDDIAALAPRAAEVSSIPLVTETDAEEVARVFAGVASA